MSLRWSRPFIVAGFTIDRFWRSSGNAGGGKAKLAGEFRNSALISPRFFSTRGSPILGPPLRPQHGFVSLRGVRLETAEFVPPPELYDPQRPTVMVLHDALGSLSVWGSGFLSQLALVTRSRVFAWSRAGYGSSDDDEFCLRERTVDFLHREALEGLPALLEATGIERPLLFGHSDGGSIVLIYAGSFPNSLSGAAVVAPHEWVDEVTIAGVSAARAESAAAPQLFGKLAKLHGGSEARARARFNDWSGLGKEFLDFFDLRTTMLPAIEAPVLAIQGLQDEYGTIAQIEVIAEKAQKARSVSLLRIPGCGHFPYKSHPAAVLEAMRVFSNEVASAEAKRALKPKA